MKGLRIGRIGRAGGCPAVSPGIVSPAGVQMRADECIPAPDDHLAASPNSRVSVLPDGRNDGAHRDNEKRFVARAVEKVTAFVELESAIGAAAAEIHTQRKT